MTPFRRTKSLPEDRQMLGATLTMAASMLTENAKESLRDGRWAHLVADLAEANRRAQISLYDAVNRALAEGDSFESLAAEAHLSPDYLRDAYGRFDREMWAMPGPDKDGREPWRVLS